MIPIAAKRRTLLLGTLIAASLAQAALATVGVFCVRAVFDTVLSQQSAHQAPPPAVLAALLLGSAVLACLIEIYRTWAGEKLGLGYVAEVRTALFERIMRAAPEALNQKRQGGLLLPFVGDLTAIKKWISNGLVKLISSSIMLVFLLAVLAFQSPLLAAIAAAVVLCAAGLLNWLAGPLDSAIRETRAKRGAIANFVSGSIGAAQTVRAFNRVGRELARLERRNTALMSAGLRLAALSGSMAGIVHLASGLLVAAVLAVGVLETGNGAMSIGLVAGAISIAGLLAGALRDLGVAFELGRRARVSFSKVGRALAIEPALETGDAGKKFKKAASGLVLEDVCVEGLFGPFSAAVAPGQIVNVVGESGSGKSTLLAVIARLRDPDGGAIHLDGNDLRRVSVAGLRRRVGIASAATPLMRGSIAMNLRYREPGATAEAIARVSAACNLAPILERLPEGDRFRLSDGARELSIGEAQRLAIARAMLGRPRLLILDDVDTHLDEQSAALIAAALSRHKGVVLMAATSPALREAADTIWRLTPGGVAIAARASGEPNIVELNSIAATKRS